MHLLSAQKSAAPTAMDATIHGDEGAVSRLNDGGGALTEVTSSSAFVSHHPSPIRVRSYGIPELLVPSRQLRAAELSLNPEATADT
jgi:hypothetical protein